MMTNSIKFFLIIYFVLFKCDNRLVRAQDYDEIRYLIPTKNVANDGKHNFGYSNSDVIDLDFDEVFKNVILACKISERAIDEDIERIMKNGLPGTRTEKCFVTCWLERFKVIRKNQFYPAQYLKLTTLEMEPDDPKIKSLQDILKECKHVDACMPERCELGFRIVKCVHDGAVKRGIDPKAF